MQYLDLKTLDYLLYITFHDLTDLGPVFPIVSILQRSQNRLASCRLSPPTIYVILDNYKEKIIFTKKLITSTTIATKTIETTTTIKPFLYFRRYLLK